jgi:hypothetical protein
MNGLLKRQRHPFIPAQAGIQSYILGAFGLSPWATTLLALCGQVSRTRVCPLVDQSRQWRILAGERLSAYDPKRTFDFRKPRSKELSICVFAFETHLAVSLKAKHAMRKTSAVQTDRSAMKYR